MPEPKVIRSPESLYRLGRSEDPLRLSEIRPEDAALRDAGNRYDIPGAGVLYAASERAACFAETLSRFRLSPTLPRDVIDGPEAGFMNLDTVPHDWRLKRRMVQLTVDPEAKFIDVTDPETHAWLTEAMAPELRLFGIDAPIDVSLVNGPDRLLTRGIAVHAYTARDEESGLFLYDGVAYASHINPAWFCWAIFHDTPVAVDEELRVDVDDEDLLKICEMWGLHVF